MKKAIISFILLITGALILTACATSNTSKTAATPPANAITPGSIIAEGHIQPVKVLDQSFTAPGEVGTILVKNGDTVKVGQALVQLGDSSTQAALAQAEAAAIQAQIALDSYKTNATLNIAQAQLALANAQKAVDDAKNRVTSSDWTRGSQDQIDAADAQRVLAKTALEKAQDYFNIYKNLDPGNPNYAQSYAQLASAQQRYDTANANLDYVSGRYSSTEAAISSGILATAQAELTLAHDKYTVLVNNNGLDPDQMAMLEAQAAAAKAAAQAAKDAQTLSASVDGSVVDIAVTPGQSVTTGQIALAIADYSSWTLVTDNLTESEVISLKAGKKVNVRLDAIPKKTFSGVITTIDSRYQVVRGDITYAVTVRLTQTDPAMRWGMTASVEFLP